MIPADKTFRPSSSTPDPASDKTLCVEPLPAFSDNYLWLIHDGIDAFVVDPGDATVVMSALNQRALNLRGILITHHHPDHVGGLLQLKAAFDVPVWGPRAESHRIDGLSKLLDEGDHIELPALGLSFEILSVPGHTLGHIAYFCDDRRWLFCGDTLFAAGCGRLFEGTAAQMLDSLQKLAALPADTQVFCAHEYTLANLAFARTVEPGNLAIADEIERIRDLRAHNRPSLPSTVARELAVNPFLRCTQAELAQSAVQHSQHPLDDAAAVFAEIRRWKDSFRPEVV